MPTPLRGVYYNLILAEDMDAISESTSLVGTFYQDGILTGTAYNTYVVSGGSLRVHNGGVANETTILYNGSMHVFSGGTANETTISSGAAMPDHTFAHTTEAGSNSE